jgi:dihydrofolate reductase
VGRLIYSVMTSLDGYVADDRGKFDWAKPDEEVHAFANDLERQVATHLYGRRLYEVMSYWDSADALAHEHPVVRDYAAIWQAADKVVFSTTLDSVSTRRTRLERDFHPDAIREMKAGSQPDITVGGPGLAAEAIRAGLVDEYHLLMSPIVVGGGTHFLPGGVRVELELLDERRFANGVVHLHYRARS